MSLTVPASTTEKHSHRRLVVIVAVLLVMALFGALYLTLRDTSPNAKSSDQKPVSIEWRASSSQLPTLPYSATDGPLSTDSGIATGFSHTEIGAVLAVEHLTYEVSGLAGPNVYRRAWAKRFLGDSTQDIAFTEKSYAQLAQQQGVAYGSPLTAPASTPVFQGYVIRDGKPTGDRVVIQIINRTPASTGASSYSAAQVTLQWQANDWFGVLDDNTPITPIAEPPPDMKRLQ